MVEGEPGPIGLLAPGSQREGSGFSKVSCGATGLESSSGQARNTPTSPSKDVPKGSSCLPLQF